MLAWITTKACCWFGTVGCNECDGDSAAVTDRQDEEDGTCASKREISRCCQSNHFIASIADTPSFSRVDDSIRLRTMENRKMCLVARYYFDIVATQHDIVNLKSYSEDDGRALRALCLNNNNNQYDNTCFNYSLQKILLSQQRDYGLSQRSDGGFGGMGSDLADT